MILTMVPTAACKTLVLFEKDGEIIADNLKKRGWSLGRVSAVNSKRRTIWIVDAHRDGKRSVVRADEKLDCVFAIRIGDSIRFTPSPRIRALISNFLMVYSV